MTTNQLAEAYLDRKLTEVERRALENRAQQDILLQRRIEIQQDAISLLSLASRSALAEKLKHQYAETQRATGRKRAFLLRIVGAAAGVLLIGMLGWIVWSKGESWMNHTPVNRAEPAPSVQPAISTPVRSATPADPASLAKEMYSPISLPDLQLSKGKALYAEAGQAYESGDYAMASTLFRQLIRVENKQPSIGLALGAALIAADSAEAAIQVLSAIAQPSNPGYQPASWYLALGYAQAGMTIQAYGMMDQIAATEGHLFQDAAKTWLERLQ